MLLELNVSHFAIIDNIHIEFTPGFNVLSGETGAGKSILLKSLSLLMGAKSSVETIRTGCSSATIEGLFDLRGRPDITKKLDELGLLADENELIVRRVISNQGKSKVYLNGGLSTLQNLRDLVFPLIEITGHSAPLIEMTGQHDSRQLLSKAYHLDILDGFSASFNKREQFQDLYYKLKDLRKEIDEFETNAAQLRQQLDYLTFQRNEIRDLGIQPGEEGEVEQKVKLLKNSSQLSQFYEEADFALYSHEESVIAKLYKLIQAGSHLSTLQPELQAKLDILKQAKTLIEECVYEFRELQNQVGTSEGSLDELEARLSQLKKIKKKHGVELNEVLAKLDELDNEIDKIENFDDHLEHLHQQAQDIEKQLFQLGEDLHKKRVQGSKKLEKGINAKLLDLNMKGVEVQIEVKKETEISASGLSDVEFMVKNSKKGKSLALNKVASGGEMSRILLALKQTCGKGEQPRTYLFDEVDAGVSGETAEKVGKKLKSISQGQQVICITHLPQVARFADSHFLIQKSTSKDVVKTRVIALEEEKRIKEIARLISGEKITKSSLTHARELLKH